jgi:ferredoxin--NADP+ reductase
MSEQPFNATLIERQDVTEELSIVKVRGDGGFVPEFKAGQFVTLGLPRAEESASSTESGGTATRVRLVRRAYSIASSPEQRDYLELYVVLVAGGKLTPRLWTVDHGGRLFMDPRIMGEFTLDGISPDMDLVFVATGTGVAPFISMLRSYCGGHRWRQCMLIHNVRKAAHLGYRQEMEALSRQYKDFIYVPIVSGEDGIEPDWTGLCGRAQTVLDEQKYTELTGSPLDPQRCHVFLCGNPAMIVDVQKLLEDRGFKTHSKKEPGNIHFERYW